MKNAIRIQLSVLAAVVAMAAGAQGISLAEARAKIGDAVSDPAVMTATIKQLSADDQKAFLAECNQAIEKMPGSNEEKAAAFLNANRAALKGAKKGNLSALVAEVYATVPPEALTVINERFASDLFNRAADPSVTYTDKEFAKIAENLLTNICARVASTDNAGVRGAFALMMLVRASNSTDKELINQLVSALPESSREAALNEWLPSALADGDDKSYEPILGAADAPQAPNEPLVIRIAGPQQLDGLLADLNGPSTDPSSPPSSSSPMTDAATDPTNTQSPSDSGDAAGNDPVERPPKEEEKPDEGDDYQTGN